MGALGLAWLTFWLSVPPRAGVAVVVVGVAWTVASSALLWSARRPGRAFVAVAAVDALLVVLLVALAPDGAAPEPALLALAFLPLAWSLFAVPRTHAILTLPLILGAGIAVTVAVGGDPARVVGVTAAVAASAVVGQLLARRRGSWQAAAARGATIEALAGEGRERMRLADLLHDGPLQNALWVRGELGADPYLRDGSLDLARSAIDETIDELRALSHGLDPIGVTALDERLAAIAAMHERGGRLRVDLTVAVASTGYDDLVASAVRELLANVGKHASATAAAVSVGTGPDAVRLAVVDDGEGYARHRSRVRRESGRGQRRGLASLERRVVAVGGTLLIESPVADGRGTLVTVALPRRAAERGRAAPSRVAGRRAGADGDRSSRACSPSGRAA
ncbi:sensor histidine kinase [Patulibacter defluvii]|uniref:sensor histidine kinase n=1 Tax=Patulibacter defluvii TaxID=3095358 RepID=UPI002A762277|nr:ATP-binding protein [Patulibacter sp. DM4]